MQRFLPLSTRKDLSQMNERTVTSVKDDKA